MPTSEFKFSDELLTVLWWSSAKASDELFKIHYFFLQIWIGGIFPLLVHASIEEWWRQYWLASHGGSRCYSTLTKRLACDIILGVVSAGITYQLTSLLI